MAAQQHVLGVSWPHLMGLHLWQQHQLQHRGNSHVAWPAIQCLV